MYPSYFAKFRYFATEDRKGEHRCRFVSSKGLMRSCDVHDALPNEPRVTWARGLVDDHQPNGTIYVHPEALAHFIKHAVPQLTDPFILVSGNSVLPIGSGEMSMEVVQALLDHPLLLRWHAQNLTTRHPKLSALPLGLDYHTLAWHVWHRWGLQRAPVDQELALLATRRIAKPIAERRVRGYCNWQFTPNPKRLGIAEQLAPEAVFFEPRPLPRRKCWVENARFAFTISPEGVGLDCHRTWEAILLGSVPIIQDLPINQLFEDLPVVVIGDWQEITESRLAAERDRVLHTKFDFSAVFLRYWRQKLRGNTPNRVPPMGFQQFLDLDAPALDDLIASTWP